MFDPLTLGFSMLDPETIEQWRTLQEQRAADSAEQKYHDERDQRRLVAQAEMLRLLSDFLSNRISLAQFRTIFDSKTRNEWDVFGFKGLSGAMFLNKLAKHLPDLDNTALMLREVLPAPPDSSLANARAQLHRFDNFLKHAIDKKWVTPALVQPARMPFFVSAWWHIQQSEIWPVFYNSGRVALQKLGTYRPSGNPIEDYLQFRELFLQLQKALSLSPWETEHLLSWYNEKQDLAEVVKQPQLTVILPAVQESNVTESTTATEEKSHTQIQYLLSTIGHKLGCKVWIAANDHHRKWQGTRLGDLSIPTLPNLGVGVEAQSTINLIDVIWLKSNYQVVAAFEVEHTTSVYSGLLRLADLVALAPNLAFPLYIAAPEARLDKVRRELSRPAFRVLDLPANCSYFSFEDLIAESNSILRWATSPEAIERLAKRIGDG